MEARGILIEIMNKILVCLCRERERFDFIFLLRRLLNVSKIREWGDKSLMTRCSLQFHTHRMEN